MGIQAPSAPAFHGSAMASAIFKVHFSIGTLRCGKGGRRRDFPGSSTTTFAGTKRARLGGGLGRAKPGGFLRCGLAGLRRRRPWFLFLFVPGAQDVAWCLSKCTTPGCLTSLSQPGVAVRHCHLPNGHAVQPTAKRRVGAWRIQKVAHHGNQPWGLTTSQAALAPMKTQGI